MEASAILPPLQPHSASAFPKPPRGLGFLQTRGGELGVGAEGSQPIHPANRRARWLPVSSPGAEPSGAPGARVRPLDARYQDSDRWVPSGSPCSPSVVPTRGILRPCLRQSDVNYK